MARRVLWRPDTWRHPIASPALLGVLVVVALHGFYLRGPLLWDEGGFAMVARWWDAPGGELYGAQWVDRPPGLIGTFWIANHLGVHGPRIVATVVAAIFVLAAAWAGWAAKGERAARWSTLAAVFLMTTPLSQTFALNGELVASAWTMVAVAAAVTLVRRPSTRWPRAVALAVVAGFCAGAAVMTKQNYFDAAVFVAVLGLGHVIVDRHQRSRLLGLAGAAVLGFAVPLGLTAWWAITHNGLSDLIYALYGFRADAARVMAEGPQDQINQRRDHLPVLALGSGLLTVGLTLVVLGLRRVRRPSPLWCAVVAAGVIETVGIVFGGNYWSHYLIGLSPMVALAAGVLAPERGVVARIAQAQIWLAVLVAVVATPIAAQAVARPTSVDRVGVWLKVAAHRDDSAVVLYSKASIIETARLRPAYPLAWSLPVRTRDRHLAMLNRVLTDPATAPTWVIGWDAFGHWGLEDDQVQVTIARDYTQVATVCGHPVWLRHGVTRTLGPDTCLPGKRYTSGA